MGHLGRLKSEYRALVGRLDAGRVGLPEPGDEAGREARRELLEILFSSEEAEIASRVPLLPASLGEIAKRTGMAAAGHGRRALVARAARVDRGASRGSHALNAIIPAVTHLPPAERASPPSKCARGSCGRPLRE